VRKAHRSARYAGRLGSARRPTTIGARIRRSYALRDEAAAENGKLKKIVADLSLDKEMLQDVIRRKL
jgi:hypothetical protein